MGATLPALAREINTTDHECLRGLVSSTARISLEQSWDACSLVSTYCASMTCTRRRTPQWRSTCRWQGIAFAFAGLIPRAGDPDDRIRPAPASVAGKSARRRLRRHFALGAVRVGRRSDLDAHAGTALRRLGLRAFHHRRRLSRRPRDRQRHRGIALSNPRVSARGLGLVPMVGCLRDRLDRVQSGRSAPILADQPFDLLKHLVQLRAGSRARILGPVASDASRGARVSPWRLRRPRPHRKDRMLPG